MKIKLSEDQYNRLLVENDKSFLDGNIDFPHIGNKVNKFIVKLFNYLHQKVGPYTIHKQREIRQIMVRDFGLTLPEAKVLTHNYGTFSSSGEVDEYSSYLGEPLEYWGEFRYNTTIPITAYVSGDIEGWVTGHATSYDEFIDQLKEGDWEDIDSDWSDEIESYPEDAEWDIDSDYAFDRIRDEIDGIEEYRGKKDILQKIEID